MHTRKVLRALPVVIFTFFIVLLVDFRMRTKHSHGSHGIRGPHQPGNPPSPDGASAAQDAPNPEILSPEAVDISTLNRRETDPHEETLKSSDELKSLVSPPPLKLTDIFIAVKTTGRFHSTRLALLIDTWISKTKDHTYIFTDAEDEDFTSKGFHMVVTDCPSDHSHQALSCKMSAEYDHFIASDKRWLCHVDDDNYLNPGALLGLLSSFPPDGDVYVGKPSLDRPITAHELLEGNKTREVKFWFATGGAGFCLSRSLADKMRPWASGPRFEQMSAVIRLPDDCTVGFIVELRLGVPMMHCPSFHSHLENLLLLSPSNIPLQVTLSYGLFENKMNSVELKGVFSKEEDPSRFRSVHCLLYPFTSWCP